MNGDDSAHQSTGVGDDPNWEVERSKRLVLTSNNESTLNRPIMMPVESRSKSVALAMRLMPPGRLPGFAAPWMRPTMMSKVTLLSGQLA